MSFRSDVRAFQRSHGLSPDGDPGRLTWRAVEAELRSSAYSPSKPPFRALTLAQKRRRFGDPMKGVKFEGEQRRFKPNRKWKRESIVAIERENLPPSMHEVLPARVWLHREAVPPFNGVAWAWHRAGLGDLILSWNGSIAFRLIRGGRWLSSHAFGIAFDVNARWNGLGKQPAPMGAEGCVLEMVKIAHAHGWFWGGHFGNRPDGMHLELAV